MRLKPTAAAAAALFAAGRSSPKAALYKLKSDIAQADASQPALSGSVGHANSAQAEHVD